MRKYVLEIRRQGFGRGQQTTLKKIVNGKVEKTWFGPMANSIAGNISRRRLTIFHNRVRQHDSIHSAAVAAFGVPEVR